MIRRSLFGLTARSYTTPSTPLLPAAIQLWEKQQLQQQQQKQTAPKQEPDEFFDHPLYTPIERVDTSFPNPLPKPLHWPKHDQQRPSIQKTQLPFAYNNLAFDDTANAPLGGYPRMEQTWTQLKDPYAYWDQQGRRNYGEILHDMDNFSDIMGIGPEQSPAFGLTLLGQAILFVSAVIGLVYLISPEKMALRADKDYPFDGLRVELGGDPNDKSDNFMAGKSYSE